MARTSRTYEIEETARLAKLGWSNRRIGARFEVSSDRVSQWKHEARVRGLLPPLKPKSEYARVVNRLVYRGAKMGSMRDLFEGMPVEVADWLVDSVPEGATVGDLIRSILVDAHAEEAANA